MEGYKSFAVKVTGRSHKNGVCQDYTGSYEDEGVSIAVVADGHGDSSCFRSDRGSMYAVNCAIKGIQQFVKEQEADFKRFIKKPSPPSRRGLEKLLHEQLIKQTVASWNRLVMTDYQKNPFTEQELENVSEKYRKRYEKGETTNKAYGTSLIAAAITPWYWFGFHIGDGRFTVLYQDGSGSQPVPWDEKCYLNVTTSICDDDILDRYDDEEERYTGVRTFLSMKEDEAPPIAFFICSDGVDDNYPVEENEEHLYKLYRKIAVTFVDYGYEATCGQIEDLAKRFATEGKGDDTSLAGIINMEELKKAAPVLREMIEAAEAKKAADKAAEAEEAKAAEKAAEDAAARREARRAERESEREATKAEEKAKAKAEKPKADAGKKPDSGENIETYGEFSSNAEQSGDDEAKSKAELVQDAKKAIDEAAKKIDMLV